MGRLRAARDEGFTLVETIIAIMLLMIVMATLAPMFFSAFKSTSVTNARSAAISLATEASEQMRAYPYYEVGYYSADQPAACSSATQTEVSLDSTLVTSEPLKSLATAATENHTAYTIQRCVYWVGASTGDSAAYKEAVVTVYWTGQGTTLHVSQTSSIYPGGESGYSAYNDQIPTSSSVNCSTGTPGIPSNVTASDDATAPNNTIDVSWTASSPAADYYVVEYTSQGNPGNAPIDQAETSYTVSPETTATYTQLTVGAGTQYWIQVQAVACGTPSPNSLTVTATTTTASSSTSSSSSSSSSTTSANTTIPTTTTTTTATCSLYNLTVVPTGATGVTYAAIDNSTRRMHDYSANTFSLTLSTSNSAYCSNVYVAYTAGGGNPTACVTGAKYCYTDWVQLSPSGTGTFTGTATTGSSDNGWGENGTSFVVYFGEYTQGVQYSPPIASNFNTCKYSNGNGSTCT